MASPTLDQCGVRFRVNAPISVLDPDRLQQVEENRKAVTNEIKKSICNLIMEINRKGKMLVNQLEVSFGCIPYTTVCVFSKAPLTCARSNILHCFFNPTQFEQEEYKLRQKVTFHFMIFCLHHGLKQHALCYACFKNKYSTSLPVIF